MTAASTAPPSIEAAVNLTPPDREPRCRYHNRHGNPCHNPSLDPEPMAIQICVRHVREVLDLLRDHRARYQNRREDAHADA